MKTRLEARPYAIGDCLRFQSQDAQIADLAPEDRVALATRAPEGPAWSFFRGQTIVACGGILTHRRQHEAWAIVAADAGPRERARLILFARAALENFPARRIEATVRDGWEKACTVLNHLGFVKEGVKRCAAWDGADLHLFARVV